MSGSAYETEIKRQMEVPCSSCGQDWGRHHAGLPHWCPDMTTGRRMDWLKTTVFQAALAQGQGASEQEDGDNE